MNRPREESAMEMGGEHIFSHDPFLSLQNDLDDVSGKFLRKVLLLYGFCSCCTFPIFRSHPQQFVRRASKSV